MLPKKSDNGYSLEIACSPCPNDIYIFYALMNKKISTYLNFNFKILPIHQLNNLSKKYFFDLVKVSIPSYFFLKKEYSILPVGTAIQDQQGPKIISRIGCFDDIKESTTIISPGKDTTAETATKILFGCNKFYHCSYTDIFYRLNKSQIDHGIIIHESRNSVESRGFKTLYDLGKVWSEKNNHPLPLGCLIIKNKVDKKLRKYIISLIQDSILWAKSNEKEVMQAIVKHSQEKDINTVREHIDNFVTKETLSLSNKGINAIKYFIGELTKLNISN